MPIYEFHCEKCGKDNEILVRSSNWEGSRCPECGSTKLSKKLSVFASSTGGENSAPSCGMGAKSGGCGCRAGKHNH
jgi:putative FmdB family regulatory protein